MANIASVVNQYFDHVYILNLKKRTDRKWEMLHKLSRLGIAAEFVEAINGYQFQHQLEYLKFASSPVSASGSHPLEASLTRKAIENEGAWGCLKSYLHILEDAKQQNYRRILCLEDDAIFHHHFEDRFKKAIRSIPDDWKLLYLGASQQDWTVPNGLSYSDPQKHHFDSTETYYYPRKTNGSFAIGFDAAVFDLMIQEISKMDCSLDSGPMRTVSNTFPDRSFVIWPNLIIADVTDSDIRGKREQGPLSKKLKWNLEDYDFQFQGKKEEGSLSGSFLKDQFVMKKLAYRQHRNISVESHKTVFFLLPKNGCSSLKSQLLSPLGMEKKEGFPKGIHQPALYPFPFAPFDELNTTYHHYFKFAIVRNPWDRLVSCFKDKIRASDYQEAGYKDGVAIPLQRFGTFYGGMTFDTFVEAVCAIPDGVADHHFRSQVHQLTSPDGVLLVNYIGRLETLEESLREISQHTGLSFSATPHLNKAQGEPYQTYYTQELAEKVGNRFETDVALLHYTFEPQDQVPSIGIVDDHWKVHFSPVNLLRMALKAKNLTVDFEFQALRKNNRALTMREKSLHKENTALIQENNILRQKISHWTEVELPNLQKQLAALQDSLSWKITAPLRNIGAIFSPKNR